jgi:hypothetical protein
LHKEEKKVMENKKREKLFGILKASFLFDNSWTFFFSFVIVWFWKDKTYESQKKKTRNQEQEKCWQPTSISLFSFLHKSKSFCVQ